MSNIDTYLNFDQAISLRGLSKLNKDQLRVSLSNNIELKELRKQLSKDISKLDNSIDRHSRLQKSLIEKQNAFQENSYLLQKQILENQIKEIEHRETQIFYKKQLFQCKEYIHDYKTLSDWQVKEIFRNYFLKIIEETIEISKNKLENINDKDFAFQLQTETKEIKRESIESTNSLLVSNILKLTKNISTEESLKDKLLKKHADLIKMKDELVEEKSQFESKTEDYKQTIQELIHRRLSITYVLGCLIIVSSAYGIWIAESSEINKTIAFIVTLLCLFIYFLSQTISSHKLSKSLRKTNSPILNTKYYFLLKEIEDTKSKINKSETNMIELKRNYRNQFAELFKHHPEFKTVDYIFIELFQ